MTTTTKSTLEAKEEFSELVNRVAHSKERIILTRRDKEIGALIPIEDYLLLQSAQNMHDLQDAMEALKEARQLGTISLDELKSEIGS